MATPPPGAENRRTLRRLTLAAATAAALTFASLPAALGSTQPSRTAGETSLQQGKRLYRKYCGQCHALRAALAAGFGSNNGLGTDGGPSFDGLRVPFNLSVLAVTQPFIGHERLVHKMTWSEVKLVARYVETVTRHHAVLAQPIDG